ncbi:MAG: putative bifunctional diguanylate cyclase/phosphodiesterase [Rhodanobacteraceae bacterium]
MADLTEPCDPLEFARLKRRLERERAARVEVETLSERGLRELYLREQELRLLQDIATSVNLLPSVSGAFQYALARICDFMAWPVGHAWLAEEHDGSIRLRSMGLWHMRDAAKIEPFRVTTEARALAPGEGLPGKVYRSGVATWLSEVGSDAAFLRRLPAYQSGFRSACAFPILVGEEIVSVIEFYTDRVIEPDAALLRLMPQIGTHLGRAIERQRAENRLIHDASHDPLTGLPNRTLFLDRLNQAIARRASNPEARFAVLFIDLDRFKIVNDSLGHLAGDRLVIQVAERLKRALRREDTIAVPDAAEHAEAVTLSRLGGDEFTILLNDIHDPNDTLRVANRVQDVLRLPFAIDGQDVYTSASIGIASSESGCETAETVLRNADLAMYRAKTMGNARCEVFDRHMHEAALQRLGLETDLRRALQNEEFVLHYQPIVSLQSYEVVGLEALVRWRRPDGQLVYPDDFIGVMEATGLIVFLGRWVLREACRACRALQQEFPREEPMTMSVNVSARQFAQPGLVAQVRSIVAETGIDPHCLRLEITESMTIGDTGRVAATLSELKEFGVRVSIDDFGTGYSSLSYLHSLPLDVLKIDRSFVAAMDKSAGGLQVVQTIMSLARNLGMEVVAEGAEAESQVEQLQSMGCGFCQGYYFSKPLDLSGVAACLKTPSWTLLEAGRAGKPAAEASQVVPA